MSVVPDSVRTVVVARSGGRCEYCHLPTRGQVATFPVDHILPRSRGGPSDLDNLALACPRCNAHKWAATEAGDPDTGTSVPLFDPRMQPWAEHFRFSRESPGAIEGLTPSGRATVERLQMNHPDMVTVRQLLAALGLFPEAA